MLDRAESSKRVTLALVLSGLAVACGAEGSSESAVRSKDDEPGSEEPTRNPANVPAEDGDSGEPVAPSDEPLNEPVSDDESANAPVSDDDVVSDPGSDISSVVLIEDSEDGDAALLLDEASGFVGYWYSYDDRQVCAHPDFANGNVVPCGSQVCAASGDATQTEPPIVAYGFDAFTMAAYADHGAEAPPLEGLQDSNERGVRLAGGGYTYTGAGVGVGLLNTGLLEPFDLADDGYIALRFLARSGVPGTTIDLRVKLKDAYSEPLAGNCSVRTNDCTSGTCVCCDSSGTCGTELIEGCHDDPTAPRAATAVRDEWQLYEIPLSDFTREGWGSFNQGGEPDSLSLDPTQVYQLQFHVATDSTPATMPVAPFELWLDNIGFIKR